ncbi:hypothetical protein BUALT_Bualt19G0075600 [Buddleja alternifolia]|uniref:DUF4283 domain-containing protein n=1 Tax=Buddleja alternifolia TaxID=168488 RepID=A0AAV6W5R1_9LAMI|nr:hypothetical protein BUALT_Bualt19G0075600 [Buddleja alternifolia]
MMVGCAKVLLILTVVFGVLTMHVKGSRILKGNDDQVDQPQTFGVFGGSYPNPGFTGPFPRSTNGPWNFCSFPGMRCAANPPSNPTGSDRGVTTEKLKGSTRPQELAARAAKKAFVHGVDTKIIGSSAVVNGQKIIFLSKEEDEFMSAPFQYALVGKFSHGYPTMTRLRAKFAALGLNKSFKIGVLNQKHVWIRLFDPNDYARIWMKQTWYFDGFPMRVLKWTADFDPTQESLIMPIWIKIFGLKPHWFHRKFLYHVASLIGKPLKLDEATTKIDNPVVARICVEINVLDKLISDIPIQIDGQTRFWDLRERLEKLRGKKLMIDLEEDMSCPSLGLADSPNGVLMRKSNKDVIIPLNKVHEQITHRGIDDFSCQGLKDVNVSSSKEGVVRIQGMTKMDQDGSVNEQEPKNTSNFVQDSSKTDQEATTSDQDQSIEKIRTDQGKFDGDQDCGLKVGKTQKKPKDVQERYKINRDCRVVSYATQKGRPQLNSINMASTKIGEREAMDDDVGEDDGEENNQPLAIGYDAEIPNSGEMEDESGGSDTSDELWQEVSSKKHRRSTSLDENSNKMIPQAKKLALLQDL